MKSFIRYNIFIILIIVLTPRLFYGENLSKIRRSEIQEYEVISALISSYLGNDFGLIIINERTEAWCIGAQLQRLREECKKIKHETIDSLIIRNSLSVKLQKKLSLNTNYILISRDKYIEILQDSIIPDWDNFDRIFPDSPGFLTVSRVGFDTDYSQALIYFCNAYRCSDNRIIPKSRNIAFFIKKDDKWVLEGIKKGFYSIYDH